MDNGKKRVLDRNFWWSFTIKKFIKENPPRSFLNKLTKDYWKMVNKRGDLYRDTISILDYLNSKAYKLGLLTDTDGLKGSKLKRIKTSNLKKWFNAIVIAGEDTKQLKPDKAPLFLIAKKLNLNTKNCIFIGNDPDVDISGAKKLGMSTILVRRKNDKIKIKPDRIVKKLEEIRGIL